MTLLKSIIIILVVIFFYFIAIEIYTTLFRMTGLTKDKAKFQVISMLTSVGFTTQESEIISSNPLRRKIAVCTMITGTLFSVLLISLVINLVTSISSNNEIVGDMVWIIVSVSIFLITIIFIKIPFMNKKIDKFIERIANLFFHLNRDNNLITQLDVYGNDAIYEVALHIIPEEIYDKTLEEMNLKAKYQINVLMIRRNKRTLIITKNSKFQAGDDILVFGSKKNIEMLFDVKINTIDEKIEITNKISIIDNYGADAMAEIQVNIVPEELKDKPLFNSGLKSIYNLNVLTIKREDENIIVDKNTVIKENDVIVVFGNYKNMDSLFMAN